MTTNTGQQVQEGYDASSYPRFAVTVDVVIFTLLHGVLQVVLVQRGQEPFAGMWAVPGGFKLPDETLDDAARRELLEETGVDAAALLVQLGAYGDPGRDPRMKVVTVAHLAVMREIDNLASGTDASAAALFPVADVVARHVELAFDHHRIVCDAVERVRRDIESTKLATAFVGPTFTLSELRAVYEAVWDVQLDGANFRRRVTSEEGWVVPTGKHAVPGEEGGKPAELFRAGRAWKQGAPLRRPRPRQGGKAQR